MRTHPPFFPYAAPRFPHISELDYFFSSSTSTRTIHPPPFVPHMSHRVFPISQNVILFSAPRHRPVDLERARPQAGRDRDGHLITGARAPLRRARRPLPLRRQIGARRLRLRPDRGCGGMI